MSTRTGAARRFSAILTALLLLGLVGLPAATAATPAPSSDRTASLTTAQFEARLVALTNARRKKVGCPAYKVHTALVRSSRLHTQRMVETGSFLHRVAREASLGTRISRAGYKNWKALAENIAWGKGVSPAKVFSLWVNSRPHRANLDNCKLRDLGYGVRYEGRQVWVTGDYGRR
ncbi:CAP domain-containing protein [Nocardioides marmoriginsengisoli]|nr:CAP domain-containing protein [Nocardioides marmoriginsengisoli]